MTRDIRLHHRVQTVRGTPGHRWARQCDSGKTCVFQMSHYHVTFHCTLRNIATSDEWSLTADKTRLSHVTDGCSSYRPAPSWTCLSVTSITIIIRMCKGHNCWIVECKSAVPAVSWLPVLVHISSVTYHKLLVFNQSINQYIYNAPWYRGARYSADYAETKRNVLSRVLNVLTDGAVRQFRGREFQSLGAATEKRRAAVSKLCGGTDRSFCVDDRSKRDWLYGLIRSAR